MEKITRADLISLEEYAEGRAAFRQRVMAHKKPRHLVIGEHLSLYFEDRVTIQYQVQEMLRIERIFEAQGIEEELSAYNPLIPDGSNLKATAMLEYEEVAVRKQRLRELRGIEDTIWSQVGDFDKVYAIANEDLDRSNEEKTSAVHFLRFEFTPAIIKALENGAEWTFGADHAQFPHSIEVNKESRAALLNDFQSGDNGT